MVRHITCKLYDRLVEIKAVEILEALRSEDQKDRVKKIFQRILNLGFTGFFTSYHKSAEATDSIFSIQPYTSQNRQRPFK